MNSSEGNSDLTTVTPNGEKVPGGGIISPEVASKFFALRNGNREKAVEDVKANQLKLEVDGSFIDSWLLTEISYWNRDKERLVILCENAIIVCKYDFVAMKIISVDRIHLKNIKKIQDGTFAVPENSMAVSRLYNGMRITWGSVDDMTWYQRWNPMNTEVPMTTFTSHPVLSLPGLEEKENYDVQFFTQSLKECLKKFPEVVVIEDQPIIIESYAGLFSYVHNQSRLGFSRERGGVSF